MRAAETIVSGVMALTSHLHGADSLLKRLDCLQHTTAQHIPSSHQQLPLATRKHPSMHKRRRLSSASRMLLAVAWPADGGSQLP